MKGIILAAGKGSRLGFAPKCLIEVGGTTLLSRQVNALARVYANPTVVVGYDKERIRNPGGWEIVFNPFWERSNTLLSLILAMTRDVDTFVINGDVLFEDDLLVRMAKCDYSAIAVKDTAATGEEITVVRDGQRVVRIGKKVGQGPEAIGVYLFRAPLVKAIREAASRLENPFKAYYEDALTLVIKDHPIDCVPSGGMEIDTPEDLKKAREMASEVIVNK